MQTKAPNPQKAALSERLAGLVERLTFHNDDSSFCVPRIKARGRRDLVTVVGTLPEVRCDRRDRMRRFLLIPVLLLIPLACQGNQAESRSATTQVADTDIAVYFSPNGGCTDAIVASLAQAKETILVQAYSFTSAPIAKAVVDAHKRGVKVQVILDKSQRTEKYSSADFLAHAGVPVQIDEKHQIAHNKIMIVDG